MLIGDEESQSEVQYDNDILLVFEEDLFEVKAMNEEHLRAKSKREGYKEEKVESKEQPNVQSNTKEKKIISSSVLKKNDKERRNECKTKFEFNVKEEEKSASKYECNKSVVIERQKQNQERTALTNIKTQNNKSRKKYIVLQRKQQSTNQKRTICNKRHY